MEAVKKAIRSALQKGDANDRAFREQVYRQAFAAFERSLQARSDLSAEDVRQRREQIKAAIIEVERGYVSREAPQAPQSGSSASSPRNGTPPSAEGNGPEPSDLDFMPRIERDERAVPRGAPAPDYSPLNEVRTPMAGRRRRRGPFALLLSVLALIAALCIGLWWIIGGIPQTAEDRSAGAPPTSSEIGEAAPRTTSSGADSDWITVFSPADPTSVSTPAGATAEVTNGSGGSYLRIGAENPDTAFAFEVGQGVLEQLAGGRAVFSLIARASEGETQISISCDFGALGDCGRTRYEVGNSPSEFLFEVELPDQQPGDGTISITPDIEGQGRRLDVFSLRVSTNR